MYRELRLLLHRELNAEPSAETRALFEQLRSDVRRQATRRGDAPELPEVGLQAAATRLSQVLLAKLDTERKEFANRLKPERSDEVVNERPRERACGFSGP